MTLAPDEARIGAVDDDAQPIDPREAARMRRRDRDADAESRGLMRPGMGKVFKQIQDSWAKPVTSTPKRGEKPAVPKRGDKPPARRGR